MILIAVSSRHICSSCSKLSKFIGCLTEKCPSDYSGLIALMQQGRFSADSDDVGVVHPTIRTKASVDGDHVLDIALSGLKVSS